MGVIVVVVVQYRYVRYVLNGVYDDDDDDDKDAWGRKEG